MCARVCAIAHVFVRVHTRERGEDLPWRPWLAGNNFRMNLNGGLHACLLSLFLLHFPIILIRLLSFSFSVHLLIHLSRSLSLFLFLVRTASLPLCRTTVFSPSCHLSLSSFSFSSPHQTFLLFFSPYYDAGVLNRRRNIKFHRYGLGTLYAPPSVVSRGRALDRQ